MKCRTRLRRTETRQTGRRRLALRTRDWPNEVEGLLLPLVIHPIHESRESRDSGLQLHVLPRAVGEELCHEEWLGQESLKLVVETRPSKRRSWLDGLLVLQGDRPTSKMDASIPEPTLWPTSPWGKTALFNDRPFLEEIDDGQNPFFGKSMAKFTIKLVLGRPPDQHATSPSRCSPPQLTHTSPAYSNLKNI